MFESVFQSFDDQADAAKGAARVGALRAELARLGLDGFVVPRADRHQNEYVPASEERLAWLSGFTGSAGLAIVLQGRAAIFVDGRYTLAVRDQVDVKIFEPEASAPVRPRDGSKPICAKARALAMILGCIRLDQVERLRKTMEGLGGELIAVEPNPIDGLWTDRPAPSMGRISLHPRKHAGEAAAKKMAPCRAAAGGQ